MAFLIFTVTALASVSRSSEGIVISPRCCARRRASEPLIYRKCPPDRSLLALVLPCSCLANICARLLEATKILNQIYRESLRGRKLQHTARQDTRKHASVSSGQRNGSGGGERRYVDVRYVSTRCWKFCCPIGWQREEIFLSVGIFSTYGLVG